MIGKWIDGLTDVERDRIVTAVDWRSRSYLWDDGARCLVGHADDVRAGRNEGWVESEAHPGFKYAEDAWATKHASVHRETRFDYLVDRFGLDRVVRACKLRAAAVRSTTVERAPTETHATPATLPPIARPQPTHETRTPR